MGLDITAYSKLVAVGKHAKDPEPNEGEPGGPDDWCYCGNHVQAYAYDSFPQSFRGIPVLGQDREFLMGGCYATTPATKVHGFRAGSYTGYNHWRADLQAQFNPRREPDLPFFELIWFADNEGCIGPEAAADLLADFRQHASEYRPAGDLYAGRYRDWTLAAELAADSGLIRFH